jgi:hypothetical protein
MQPYANPRVINVGAYPVTTNYSAGGMTPAILRRGKGPVEMRMNANVPAARAQLDANIASANSHVGDVDGPDYVKYVLAGGRGMAMEYDEDIVKAQIMRHQDCSNTIAFYDFAKAVFEAIVNNIDDTLSIDERARTFLLAAARAGATVIEMGSGEINPATTAVIPAAAGGLPLVPPIGAFPAAAAGVIPFPAAVPAGPPPEAAKLNTDAKRKNARRMLLDDRVPLQISFAITKVMCEILRQAKKGAPTVMERKQMYTRVAVETVYQILSSSYEPDVIILNVGTPHAEARLMRALTGWKTRGGVYQSIVASTFLTYDGKADGSNVSLKFNINDPDVITAIPENNGRIYLVNRVLPRITLRNMKAVKPLVPADNNEPYPCMTPMTQRSLKSTLAESLYEMAHKAAYDFLSTSPNTIFASNEYDIDTIANAGNTLKFNTKGVPVAGIAVGAAALGPPANPDDEAAMRTVLLTKLGRYIGGSYKTVEVVPAAPAVPAPPPFFLSGEAGAIPVLAAGAAPAPIGYFGADPVIAAPVADAAAVGDANALGGAAARMGFVHQMFNFPTLAGQAYPVEPALAAPPVHVARDAAANYQISTFDMATTGSEMDAIYERSMKSAVAELFVPIAFHITFYTYVAALDGIFHSVERDVKVNKSSHPDYSSWALTELHTYAHLYAISARYGVDKESLDRWTGEILSTNDYIRNVFKSSADTFNVTSIKAAGMPINPPERAGNLIALMDPNAKRDLARQVGRLKNVRDETRAPNLKGARAGVSQNVLNPANGRFDSGAMAAQVAKNTINNYMARSIPVGGQMGIVNVNQFGKRRKSSAGRRRRRRSGSVAGRKRKSASRRGSRRRSGSGGAGRKRKSAGRRRKSRARK